VSAAPSSASPASLAASSKGNDGLAAMLGAGVLAAVRSAAELYSVFARTLYYTFRGRRERGAVVRQMYEIGNRSVVFLSVTMGCIGMILVYQAGLQTKRVVPDFTLIGATYLELLVRDLAASIGSLMLATRVGAGIAAEIGSMVVTEQVDALRMCAADPIDYLLVPRFKASMIMTVVLIVWSGTVAFVAGGITAWVAFDVPARTFWNISLLDWGDLITGFVKCLAYGATIPIVSGHAGLSTFGGSEGVGWATTRAVVNSSLAIIMLNLFISATAFVVFPK
jgi:phospholipid/cholesterol/gamma-HCH transport system permease protein